MLVFISPSFPAVAVVFQRAVASDQGEQTYQSDVHVRTQRSNSDDSTLGSTTADQFTTASKTKQNRSKALVSGNNQVDRVQYSGSKAY